MKKIKILLALAVPLTFVLFVVLAPGFLFLENVPRKADAVVLFIGPGNESRLDEARQLIKEGYARYLIIPTYGEAYRVNGRGQLDRLPRYATNGNLILEVRSAGRYRQYYENTHIEALEAKRILDDLGVRTAILVSSAYHMRRIQLIAGRVFDASGDAVICNPARWQKEFTPADWLNKERRKIIVSEYVKIAWFLMYEPFRL